MTSVIMKFVRGGYKDRHATIKLDSKGFEKEKLDLRQREKSMSDVIVLFVTTQYPYWLMSTLSECKLGKFNHCLQIFSGVN